MMDQSNISIMTILNHKPSLESLSNGKIQNLTAGLLYFPVGVRISAVLVTLSSGYVSFMRPSESISIAKAHLPCKELVGPLSAEASHYFTICYASVNLFI